MPTLGEYLKRKKIGFAEFGRRLKTPRPAATVHRWVRGERMPGPKDVVDIYLTTDGGVGPADWYVLPPLLATDEREEAA